MSWKKTYEWGTSILKYFEVIAMNDHKNNDLVTGTVVVMRKVYPQENLNILNSM